MQNDENRFDVSKGSTVHLPLVRSLLAAGVVTVSWVAIPHQATTKDYSPSSGSVVFNNGQQSIDIIISILDGQQAENLEVRAGRWLLD